MDTPGILEVAAALLQSVGEKRTAEACAALGHQAMEVTDGDPDSSSHYLRTQAGIVVMLPDLIEHGVRDQRSTEGGRSRMNAANR